MESLIAILVGVLFASGCYCLMRRSIVKLVIGVVLISQGANLLVFTSGGLLAGAPGLLPPGGTVPPGHSSDPIP